MIDVAAAGYLLIIGATVLTIAAMVIIDRYLWRRSERRHLDRQWEAFSSGRWDK